jgi:KDO2-lipid IV(A) lauroyltransferase
MRYSCRPHLLEPAVEFELTDDGLARHGLFGATNIGFADIAEIAVFKERRFGSSRSYWASTIRADGQRFKLTAAHRVSLLRTEDQTSSYIPFIKEFERRAIAANPALRFIVDEYRQTLGTRMYGRVALFVIRLLSRLPRKVSASICGATFRYVGRMFRGNRHAARQLAAAFPALGTRETRRILRGMLDNIGRTFAEYGHVSELMRFSPAMPLAGQVIMDECTAETMRSLVRDKRGAIMFAAHLGNWEIPAMAARAAGTEIALLYKRQPSATFTAEMQRKRSKFAARLIEASPAAPRQILRALRDGLLVGMLVDQYYAEGVEVDFFGRVCRVNPLPARLAGIGKWPIYGARVTRLPDQRYRIEVVGPLQLPRNSSSGKIEIGATMQAIIGMIETWIRQQPEQWMWIHRLIR